MPAFACKARVVLFLEVTVVESDEAGCVASLVLGHLVDGVVESVRTLDLGLFCHFELLCASSLLGFDAHLKVGLGVVENLVAKQFCIASGVVGLFHGVVLEGASHLRIALTVGLASHGQIHAHLCALTCEGILAVGYNILAHLVSVGAAQFVYSSKLGSVVLGDLLELRGGSATERTLGGSFLAFINVTTNRSNEFLFHNEFCIFKLLATAFPKAMALFFLYISLAMQSLQMPL